MSFSYFETYNANNETEKLMNIGYSTVNCGNEICHSALRYRYTKTNF